jgi:hypothetical protein
LALRTKDFENRMEMDQLFKKLVTKSESKDIVINSIKDLLTKLDKANLLGKNYLKLIENYIKI